jgi:hypothetical protein
MTPSKDISRLIEIMAALRAPNTGCPWDIEQDFSTIAPYTIEEAYEVADAIARGDLDDLRDEADVGHAGRLAVAERAGLRGLPQHRLQRLEALAHPVPEPVGDRRVVGAEARPERVEHAQIVHRVDVAGDHLRQHAHARPALRVGRQ